jgi:hypothetical protein
MRTRVEVRDWTDAVHPEAIYQALLEQGILAVHTCTACATSHYPPRVLCPGCGSTTLEWQQDPDGRGTVYSVSVLTPPDRKPYAVVLVDLDDGPRLMSNVVGIPAAEVAIGMRVELELGERDGQVVPLFVPVADDAGNQR